MADYSVPYIVGFAAAVCGVCSIFVAGSAVALKDRQEQNKVLDRNKNVLVVAGLIEPGESVSGDEIAKRFNANIEAKFYDTKTDQLVDEGDPLVYDQRKAAKDPALSHELPKNSAKIDRMPNKAVIYLVKDGDEVKQLVLPIHGKGLWSTLYGFIAVDADGETVNGITFYEHGETPGLGGEVDNPKWKALWKGRKIYAQPDDVALKVIKGSAGSPTDDPHHVDGLSGATLTSDGVSNMISLWLGPEGYQPLLQEFTATHGGAQ